MSSSGTQFMEEHKDFVLKLKIKAADGTSQIRRVRLPRIADSTGYVSYDELVGLVVTFSFPEDAPANYSVKLTYFDVDEDTVTIASTDELVDAIEQFAGKKVLRISTEVRPKMKSGVQNRAAPVKLPTQTNIPDQTATHKDLGINPQIQTVLESFVGILSTAVTSLQEGLTAPGDSIPVPAAPKKAPPSADSDEGEATSKAAPPRDVDETSDTGTQTKQPPAQPKQPPAEEEEEEPEEEARPFIHGRHTCDSCLTTPIVGKRYNAKNLPDYDLCEKCFKNYKGTEVQFEPVELDRDRAFQERWHRRRERIQTIKKGPNERQCSRGRRGRFVQRALRQATEARQNAQPKEQPTESPPSCEDPKPEPAGVQPPPPPPPPHHMHPAFFHHHGPSPHWAHIGPHVAPHFGPHMGAHAHPHWPHHGPHNHFAPRASPSDTGGFEDALKEAIRRSLRDLAPKEAEPAQRAANEEVSPIKKAPEGVAVVESHDTAESTTASTTPEASEPETLVVPEPVIPNEPSVAEAATENLKDAVTEPAVAEVKTAEVSVMTQTEPEGQDIETGMRVNEPEEGSVVDVAPEEASVVDVVSVEKSATIERTNSEESQADDSFASDAVGSGDVAEAMGATLDMVAGVIAEMLSEADAHNKPSTKKPTSSESEVGPGETILESVGGTMESLQHAQSEESEWNFVETESQGEEPSQHDDDIGRAAEMLGSALFNSDMQSSAENVSTLSNSDSFSVPSTVPSLGSLAERRLRWSTQLSALRELGIEDEAMCIDTLERLEAANIGVGSDDDITLTQVVNAIFETK